MASPSITLVPLIIGLLLSGTGSTPPDASGPESDSAPAGSGAKARHPSGGRQLCLVCHEEFASELEGKVVHGPVADDRCTDCHSPHASRHGNLLRDAGVRLCVTCHADVAEETHQEFLHGALRDERACLACHVPHAGNHDALLNQNPDTLCATCHARVQKKLDLEQPHGPAAAGECVSCHLPHGAEQASLLTSTVPSLCWECHDAGPALEEKHRGFALGEAHCGSCHDPHGASRNHIVRGLLHPPFEDGSCDLCHADPQKPSQLNDDQPGLCVICHDDRDPANASRFNHIVDATVRCTDCHSPHAGEDSGMLMTSERPLCLSCHLEIRARIEEGASRHPVEVNGGRCTICHQPHEAVENRLLARAKAELCVECHQDHSRFSHPMGSNVPDPRNPDEIVTCVSCHDPHSSSQKKLLRADPARALCVRCHATP